jgi:hypothetical protein
MAHQCTLRHGPKPSSNTSQLSGPPHFSLVTTFKYFLFKDDRMLYCRIVKVIVPSTACVWVMMVYLLAGTIMFAEWEGWNYLDSLYFCVTSLCKVRCWGTPLLTDT